MIILPSRGRPQNVKRLADSYIISGASAPLYLRVDDDDPTLADYRKLRLPERWRLVVGERKKFPQVEQEVFAAHPDLSYYLPIGDDIVFNTPYWDRVLIRTAGTGKVSYGDDQATQRPAHPCIGGDLVRAVGWLGFPKVIHWYTDTAWQWLAEQTNRLVYCPNVIMPHYHVDFGTAENDQTYKERWKVGDKQFNEGFDTDVWNEWHASGEAAACVERIKRALGEVPK